MSRILHRLRRDERGFTIIEVMVAASLLMVGVLGTMQMVDVANQQTVADRSREGGTNLAREIVEGANHVPYQQLTPTAVTAALQELPNLESTDSATWELERRGFTYTVTAEACTVDDKVDGFRSPSAAGTYCAESSQTDTTSAQDRNGDDFRRVKVTVQWTLNGRQRSVAQSTIVNNPGDAAGPAVTTFTSSTWSPVTSTSVTQITFTAQTTAPPKTSETTKVKISLDGTYRGDATKVGTQWQWTWTGVNTLPDATYVLTAQAFDADGRSRGVRILKMVLNRSAATAPTDVSAGRNVRLKTVAGGPSIVDVAWKASNEPDVVGYRVYRSPSSSMSDATLICETSLEAVKYGTTWTSFSKTKQPTSCSDRTASLVDGQAYWYGVAPLDTDPLDGSVREAQTQGKIQVSVSSTQPPAPPTLTSQPDAVAKTVKLTWTAPTLPTGMTLDHYRIYRDGVTLTHRYDRTPGTELTWTDNQLGGITRSYYVVAVSKRTSSGGYAESAPVGPVTG